MKTKWSINSGIVADYYGKGNEVRSVRHDHELANTPRSNYWAWANHCPPVDYHEDHYYRVNTA